MYVAVNVRPYWYVHRQNVPLVVLRTYGSLHSKELGMARLSPNQHAVLNFGHCLAAQALHKMHIVR